MKFARMFALRCGAAALGCALTFPLAAQNRTPSSGISTGGLGNSPGISSIGPRGIGGVGIHPHHGFPRNGSPLTNPNGAVPIFFGSDLYGGEVYPEAEPTPVIINNVIPAAGPSERRSVDERPPASPLIIEREGDHWVRRRVADVAPGQTRPQTESELQALPQRATQPLLPMTLVFRDGHREQVGSYSIFGGALYFSNPAWMPQQRVQLSALDLDATQIANRQHGLDFRLPNSPSEVVLRP